MNLNDIKKCCEAEASFIKVESVDENGNKVVKGYQDLSKNELANGYCDWDEIEDQTTDEKEKAKANIYKSAYWAALLLRYWFKIFDWMRTSGSLHLRDIDFFNWLHDSLRDAFIYRSWRKMRRKYPKHHNGEWIENPDYIEDDCAADRSINYFCSARRGKEYQAVNKDKRRANYQTISIDQSFDEDGYSILDRSGLSETGKDCMGVKGLINQLLSEDKLVEAIIIDGIASGDAFKEDKEKVVVENVVETVDENTQEVKQEVEKDSYYKYSYEYNARKLVKFLSEIDMSYFMEYFAKEYHLSNPEEALKQLKSCSNNKLYKEIEKTLIVLKNRPDLLAFLS